MLWLRNGETHKKSDEGEDEFSEEAATGSPGEW